MKIKVRIFGDLKKTLGHQLEVELKDGSKVGDLLVKLEKRMGSPSKLIDEEGKIAENLSVLVNGLSVNVGEGPEESIYDGDTVSLLPPSGGG